MLRQFGLAALLFMMPLTALAVDYDYQAAEDRWQSKKSVLDSADASLSQQASVRDQRQREYDQAGNQVDGISNELQNNRNQQQSLHRSVSDMTSEQQTTQSQRQNIVRRIDSLNQQIDRTQGQRDDAERDLEDEQRALEQVERRIRDLESGGSNEPWTCIYVDHGFEEHSGGHRASGRDRDSAASDAKAACLAVHDACDLSSCDQDDSPELAQLRRDRDQMNQEIDRKRQDVRNYDSQVADLHNQVTNYWSEIQNIDANLDRLRREIADVQANISDLEFAEDRLNLDLQRAQNDLADARSARDRAQTNVDAAERVRDAAFQDERAAWAYYQEVLSTYNQAYSAASGKGQSDGQRDGGREAGERAGPLGGAAGQASGTTTGQTAGQAAGQDLSRVQGYNHGLTSGTTDDRLTVAYQSGVTAGTTLAQDKAHAEDYPQGYNARLNEVLAAHPTNAATYDISTELPDHPAGDGPLLDPRSQPIGSVASPMATPKTEPTASVPSADRPTVPTPGADRRYYAPACGGQPLPIFTQACESSYQSAYVGGFGGLYQTAYQNSYRTSFDPAATSAYNQARSASYPDVYLAAARIGAGDAGKVAGFNAALASARAAATQAGRLAFDAFRATGFLTILRQVDLADAVADTVLTPGEAIKVKVVIDNYGLKASPAATLRLRLESITGGEFSILLRQLPVLEADTTTTLTGVLTGKVGALTGGSVKFTAKLESVVGNAITVIDEASFEHGIRLPLELQSVRFAGPLVVGTAGSAILKWRNNTSLPLSAATLPLVVQGDPLTSTATSVAVPALAPQASIEVSVPVTATVYAGGNVPAIFSADASGVAGAGPLTLTASVAVPVARDGKLDLCLPRCGEVVALPIRVNAGTTLRIPAQFSFTGTRSAIFQFGKLGVSDPRITSSDGSTVSVGPNEWGPGSSPYRADFGYTIPTALRGQTHWITLYLKEGSANIQIVKLPIIVQ